MMEILQQQTQRFFKHCPRKLQGLPNSPCSLALLRIEFIQEGRRELQDLPGCPWYVHDVMSNFCWWSYCNQDSFGSHSTKEISQLLALTPAQVEKAEKCGLAKLGLLDKSNELMEARECIAELQQGNNDETIYAIGSFSNEIIEELGKMFCSSSTLESDIEEDIPHD